MAIQQLQEEKLFVVVDPQDQTHPALERAIITSRLRSPIPKLSIFVSCNDRASSTKNRNLVRDQQWFDKIIREPLNHELLNYEIAVSWGGKWPRTLLDTAWEFQASMILVPLFPGPLNDRLFKTSANWQLLKHAHCPVLLVHEGASEKRNCVLAAVNFQATEEQQRSLNERILGHARRVANRYMAHLYVINAYRDTLHYPDRGQLARQSGVSARRIHVRQGHTNEVIAKACKEFGADMVVIGSLNQSDSENRPWRGNTAARIITTLDVDTLIVN